MPLTAKLEPKQVGLMGHQLLEIVEADTNYIGLARLLVASRPQHYDHWRSPRVFVARQESLVENWPLHTWCEALELVLPKAEVQDAANIAGRLAFRLEQQAWIGPLPFDPVMAQVLRHASEQQLHGILKGPLAVGGLREIVLQALALKRQQNS